LPVEPSHSTEAVDEIGQADLGLRSDHGGGAKDQPAAAFLSGEGALDASVHPDAGDVAVGDVGRLAAGLLAPKLRLKAAAFEHGQVVDPAEGGSHFASSVVRVEFSAAYRPMRRYLTALIAIIAFGVGCCFLINAIVDPLWCFRGNLLRPVNFAFNERMSKMILLMRHLKDYDCLILGSSRVSLLPVSRIKDHHCFNLAFSAGQADEFIAYAHYLRSHGFSPALLIVGVEFENFKEPPAASVVPDFVRELKDPPSAISLYTSLDALRFSILSMEDSSPIDRYYDRDFQCRVPSNAPVYVPPKLPAKPSEAFQLGTSSAARFFELRRMFPVARAIGYVPPISAWTIAQLSLDDQLGTYLAALDRTAAAFDDFFDFGVPSDVTADPKNTYDGTHYSEQINARIAAALEGEATVFGVRWSPGGARDIADLYYERLRSYRLLPATPQE
jgi:hypothetical protein